MVCGCGAAVAAGGFLVLRIFFFEATFSKIEGDVQFFHWLHTVIDVQFGQFNDAKIIFDCIICWL